MKNKYYVVNEKGERILIRTSANEYKYVLVDIKKINNGEKSCYACSSSYENIMKQYNYWTKYYQDWYDACVKNNDIEIGDWYKLQRDNLKIVELVK